MTASTLEMSCSPMDSLFRIATFKFQGFESYKVLEMIRRKNKIDAM